MILTIHSAIEKRFDRLADIATRVLGSSITFIIALCVVGFWVSGDSFRNQNFHGIIRDSLLAITFLSFFIVQKSVNRYSAAMHLKLNELIASNKEASNDIVNIEHKTEEEIRTLAKEYENIKEKNDGI